MVFMLADKRIFDVLPSFRGSGTVLVVGVTLEIQCGTQIDQQSKRHELF